MIRLTVLSLFILFICAYAFRDWWASACGLLLMTMMIQRDDMPTNIMGIQGLNPWNLTLLVITFCWLLRRLKSPSAWGIPGVAKVAVFGYAAAVVMAYVFAAVDVDSFPSQLGISILGLTSDELINPLKYCWLAYLLADGVVSEQTARIAVGVVLLLGVLYAMFVVKVIPFAALTSDSDFMRYRGRIDRQVGLHANDMAKVLSMTLWSIVVCHRLWMGKIAKMVQAAGGVCVLMALAMCYSRAGYATLVAVGIVVAFFRIRKLLLLGPAAILLICVAFPRVVERSLVGFGDGQEYREQRDWNEITAGRTGNLWPPIVEEIQKSPIIGHGRRAILRTPAYNTITAMEGTCPNTPHNGYLEVLVDTGFVGMLAVAALYLVVFAKGLVFLRQSAPVAQAVGGLGVVHVTGCLTNALSGGILFPDQGMLGTMCAFALVIRMWGLKRMAQARRAYVPAAAHLALHRT